MTADAAMQLSREALLGAYREMATIRCFEDRVHDLFETGALPGFVHLYAGEEASAVGVCSHLTDDDRICSTHRGHGHCIAKGVNTGGMMLELFGRRDGVCGGKATTPVVIRTQMGGGAALPDALSTVHPHSGPEMRHPVLSL